MHMSFLFPLMMHSGIKWMGLHKAYHFRRKLNIFEKQKLLEVPPPVQLKADWRLPMVVLIPCLDEGSVENVVRQNVKVQTIGRAAFPPQLFGIVIH